MTVSRPDPDKLRYNFFTKNKWCAPRTYHWEEGRCHYTFMRGYHPAHSGWRVLSTLERLWDGVPAKINLDAYRKYVGGPDVIWDHLTDLTPVAQVYGDCTWENIVIGDSVVLIDPGYPRGFMCQENDLGKLLQSERGWELVKAGLEPKTFPGVWPRKSVVASYVTHLHRLVRHVHPVQCITWAKKEIEDATNYLLS